jgi:hypothetical protein
MRATTVAPKQLADGTKQLHVEIAHDRHAVTSGHGPQTLRIFTREAKEEIANMLLEKVAGAAAE